MPTVTTNSIGAGKTYSTVDLWADACPADLTSSDEIWKGVLYNAELLVTSSWQMSLGGVTTSATQYLWLTTATGEGFADLATPSTDTLRYDSSRGASLRITGTYTRFFSNNGKHVLIEGVQMKHDNTGSGSWVFIEGGSQTYFRRCIVETMKTGGSFENNSAPKWINSLLVARGSGGSVGAFVDVSGSSRNCTLVRPDDLSTHGGAVDASFGVYPTVKNTAVFGKFNVLFGGTISSYPAGGYNASSVADTPGSNDQASKAYSSQFENVNDATRDWRVKSTADLVNNGTRDQGTEGDLTTIGTNDLDILGRARSTSTPTIGCWEYISSGVTGTLSKTNANDTSAASGTTTIVGTLAKTNANDTSAASGTTTVLGALAKTNANDTSAASGTVGSGGSTGTLAYTNANDSVVASGKTTILGVLSKTNANDSVVASGWAGRITGTLAKTNNNDTVVANGTSGTATTTTVAPTEPNSIDWGALVAKTWGKDYVKPEWDYEFSNGRRFLEKKNPYA